MFFPKPIRQGISEAENFAFTFNCDQQQNLGLLQARRGNLTNLLVICSDGSVYNYILKYKKDLSKLTYFFKSGIKYWKRTVSKRNIGTAKEPEYYK
ncbi:hypothetical protein [Zunongwangia endophytica]|uniref:KTSC domain-containing protein n=1 Tax=Zunongwangia endophytica TaxID=1808945 RepID=A0ABV8H2I0_9FLAO|nr:hypothetical protein [Zunongwangia endophytica]MDN3594406.1 hypothetical protein [Zunongwangia endophytica]